MTATVGTVTVARVTGAEWIKLRTTRSTLVATLTSALLIVAVGAFSAVGAIAQDPSAAPDDPVTADPLGGSLSGISSAAFAIATLGVLAVTSEYATGTIKPTLAAVPRRLYLVVGKAVALAATTLITGLVAVFATFFVAQAIVAVGGFELRFTDPGVPRVLVGAVLYLTGVALMAAALGWLLRSTAGALAVLLGVFVLLPVLGLLLPKGVGDAVLPYLPGNAGAAIMQLTPDGQLGPWAALAVFFGYASLALIGATIALRRRDA